LPNEFRLRLRRAGVRQPYTWENDLLTTKREEPEYHSSLVRDIEAFMNAGAGLLDKTSEAAQSAKKRGRWVRVRRLHRRITRSDVSGDRGRFDVLSVNRNRRFSPSAAEVELAPDDPIDRRARSGHAAACVVFPSFVPSERLMF
jgi:hypothetical protein